jgi:hypothetical protein
MIRGPTVEKQRVIYEKIVPSDSISNLSLSLSG